jgi:hypothetical protein
MEQRYYAERRVATKRLDPRGGTLREMTDYIKAELDSNGIAVLSGQLEKVDERVTASRLSCGDAQFFQRKAFEHWPDFDWKIEDVGAGRYLVKADAMTAKRKNGT